MAGTSEAIAATTSTSRTTPDNVVASDEETPYNIVDSTRPNMTASPQPATQPSKATPNPCNRNCFTICPCKAPSQPQPHFSPPHVHRITQRPIQAHASKRHRRGSKERQQNGAKTILCESFVKMLRQRHDIEDRSRWLDFVNFLPDGLGHGHWFGTRANEIARIWAAR